MDWYYNNISGVITQMPSWDPVRLAPGWHGPFPTRQAAFDYYNAHKAEHNSIFDPWVSPTGPSAILTNPMATSDNIASATSGGFTDTGNIGDLAKSPLNPFNVLKTPFGDINFGQILLQFTEILIGVVLIGVGLAKLTGTTNIVVNTLGTAVKTAAVVK